MVILWFGATLYSKSLLLQTRHEINNLDEMTNVAIQNICLGKWTDLSQPNDIIPIYIHPCTGLSIWLVQILDFNLFGLYVNYYPLFLYEFSMVERSNIATAGLLRSNVTWWIYVGHGFLVMTKSCLAINGMVHSTISFNFQISRVRLIL